MNAVTWHKPNESAQPSLTRLDELLDLAPYQLEAMYVTAKTPVLANVTGDLRGRMLAWPSLDRAPRVAKAIRRFAGSNVFPWRGKSFSVDSTAASQGQGINRVISDRFRLFRFETRLDRSRAGDFDAVQLDYDLPGNPPVIRSIKDEIREIAPNLWLGQAWYQRPGGDWLWLYFALARVT